MKNIALTISYDGTDFFGWQCQNDFPTIQGEIENALKKIHKHPVVLTGSGRTDAGVHAVGQVANFLSDIDSMQAKNFVPALNSLLPPSIRILKACKKNLNFNARFSATSRTYRYFLHCSNDPQYAHESRYVWKINKDLDLSLLNQMADFLHGEIDFASFSSAKDKSQSTFRYVEKARFFRQNKNKLVFEITANAFLWKMIRSIVGTMVILAKNKKLPDEFNKILKSCKRESALLTAPPTGLFLWKICYSGKRRGPKYD